MVLITRPRNVSFRTGNQSNGRRILTVVPRPWMELSSQEPPSLRSTAATIGSPRPLPGMCRTSLERASSPQTWSTSEAGMPRPVSETSTTTCPRSSMPRTSSVAPGEEYFTALLTTL